MLYKTKNTVKGTNLIFGELAANKRKIITSFIEKCSDDGFNEIFIPVLESQITFVNKAGEEILNQMYCFEDKSERNICLIPEGTATIQNFYKDCMNGRKDVKLFYVTECFRYEQPQSGRYRQFTQFGVEWLNPRNEDDAKSLLLDLSESLIKSITNDYIIDTSVKRGLSYYVENGFEISCEKLGSQKQVCGGGKYNEGIGFAFGVDRLLLL